jgi:hypothetical protein
MRLAPSRGANFPRSVPIPLTGYLVPGGPRGRVSIDRPAARETPSRRAGFALALANAPAWTRAATGSHDVLSHT